MKFFRKSLYTKMLFLAFVIEAVLALIVLMSFYIISLLNSRDNLKMVESQFLEANKYRYEFSKTRELDKEKEFKKIMDDIEIRIDKIGYEEELTNLKEIKNKYESQFAIYVDKTKLRGLDETQGLEGEFRANVHDIEKVIESQKSHQLMIDILQARRSEKDFIMRKSDKYVGKVQKSIASLKTKITNSDLPDADKQMINKLADKYLMSFGQIVQVFQELDQIEKELEQLETQLKIFSESFVAERSKLADLYQNILYLSIAASVLISLLLAVRIAKKISKPIIKLNAIANELSRANYDVEVDIESSDEIGNLAETFRTMLTNMKQYNQIITLQKDELRNANIELEAKVEERTQQLEHALQEVRIEMEQKEEISNELIIAQENLSIALQREKELNDMKSQFVSMVSHEYRSPLTVILSSTYILEKCFSDGNKEFFDTQLGRIQASVKTMTNLLDDVLFVGKSDTGRIEARRTNVDLVDFIRKIVDNVKYVDNNNQKINFHTVHKSLIVNSDPVLINHFTNNLISNASKYSDGGTNIDIKLEEYADRVSISVTDQGKGMAEHEVDTLFEPFVRGNNSENTTGTGLGLTIAKRMVETLNGTIKVISKLGFGTTFQVLLPKA